MQNKKTAIITGGAGFIGSNLTDYLISLGWKVKVIDNESSESHDSFYWNDQAENHKLDICDYENIRPLFDGVDIVFHLAALIGIPYSYTSPLAYIRTNIEGAYNILEASKNIGLEQVIITSTSETYGTAQYSPINEKHPLVGQSPYSASKIAADQLALSYYRSFELPLKIVRPFNTYGPRQSARAASRHQRRTHLA